MFVLLLVKCINDGNLSNNDVLDNQNKKISKGNSIDTNEIINLISMYEYIKREQYREIYSKEKIQQLKNSINYDSIMLNQELPVFENPN